MNLLERGLELLRHRAASYRDVFLGHGQSTDDVLQDLAKFCRAHESTFHVEHSMSDRLDGRREVWLRIAHHLHLNEEQLWAIYGNKSIPPEPEE
jgi:hypothetical protein